ncbi:GntR family transcriptional regulator [Micromonospora humida]|uniref:GntR family transcriptional regulator n=1 Tax=Micromonospora humida TaxID=2809018 RepID=A0ABS2IWD3_9ACTN|nr:GntR family transcriptional regulator [Micromonospora humida]MBM7078583.1 GntR family transcriptional regulator [Micromonospora humida]
MPTPHHRQPRYRTIADELRSRIESGVIPPGSLLPTEASLTAEFRASRGTVRQAIASLREERLVATAHGRGTYVAFPLEQGDEFETTSIPSSPRHVPADEELAAIFDVETGSPLVEVRSVLQVNGNTESVICIYSRPLQGAAGQE